MIKIIRILLLIFISFVLSFELISYVIPQNNILNVNEKGNSYVNKENNDDVYFVGDSYASTGYVEQSFPILFRDYFKSRSMNFIDLSRPGSELADHKKILDSISNYNPKLIIYFYNISDVVSLNDEILLLNDRRNISLNDNNDEPKKKSSNIIKKVYNNSKSVLLFKQALQYLSILLTDRFFPGTPAYAFPRETLKNKKELEEIFNSIKAQNLFILINTPFNTGEIPKKWEQYKVFNEFSLTSDYTLMQSVDILNDSKYGVSWRNGHPNQEAIKIIADTLKLRFNSIK